MNNWLIHLQAELGDIVYVELPEVGSEVKKGEQFGVIESVKVRGFCAPARLWFSRVAVQGQLFSVLANPLQAASDVNSPVSGEVSAVNDTLTDESSMVCPRPKSVAGISICSLGKGIYSTCVFSVSLLASGLLFNSSKMSCSIMFMYVHDPALCFTKS